MARANRGEAISLLGRRIEPADAGKFIVLHPERPMGSTRNVWPVTVTDIDQYADRVRVRLNGEVPLVAEITPGALVALALQPGERMWAAVKATETLAYPA